jgi:HK97 family phage portal protein
MSWLDRFLGRKSPTVTNAAGNGAAAVEVPVSPLPAAANGAGNGAGTTSAWPWSNAWPGSGWGFAGAENVATLCACVDVISSAIASLPPIIYETMPNGERREAPSHPVARLLAQPNDLQTWPDLVKFFMSSVLLAGNALVEIQRDGNGQPVGLIPIVWSNAQPILLPAPPGSVSSPLSPGGRLAFDVLRTVVPFGGSGTPRRLFADNGELFFLRDRSSTGVLGASRLTRAPLVLQQALSVQGFATHLWENAGTPNIVLSHPGRLSTEAGINIAQSWRSEMAGPLNARKLLLLEEGMKAEGISASAEDSEVLASRKFAAEEIARLYGVPPPLVGIWDHSTFTNSQQANAWFGQNTLRPWVVAICREMARSVFLDPSRFCLDLDLAALVQGDFPTRAQVGINLVRAGILSADEIREELGFNRRGGAADQLLPMSVGGRPPGTGDGEGDALPAPGAPSNGSGRANGAGTSMQ